MIVFQANNGDVSVSVCQCASVSVCQCASVSVCQCVRACVCVCVRHPHTSATIVVSTREPQALRQRQRQHAPPPPPQQLQWFTAESRVATTMVYCWGWVCNNTSCARAHASVAPPTLARKEKEANRSPAVLELIWDVQDLLPSVWNPSRHSVHHAR